jgi:hypothetical protein
MTLTFEDIDSLGEAAINRFDERVAQVDPSLRCDFDAEVARLESQLDQLYALTARMARNEPDVERTAELWTRLVQICDAFAHRVYSLSQEHPACRASYDHMLDLRCAAEERRALHSA